MRTATIWLAMIGCGEEIPQAPEVEPAPAPAAITVDQGADPAELLAKGPPELGPIGRVVEKIAAHYGAGVVRCPLPGNGRVRQNFGNERDQLTTVGPLWTSEIDPATDPPWDPVFDQAASENDWLTLPVVAGSTKAWAGSRARMLQFDFPPAVAGQTTVCTGVSEVPEREVRGRVAGTIPPQSSVVPCLFDPVFVAEDGTFATKVPVPCRLWVDGNAVRSEKILVEPGAEPAVLSFTMARDPLRNEDGSWTEAAVQQMVEVLDKADARYLETTAYLETLRAEVAEDKVAASTVHSYQYELNIWGRSIQKARQSVDMKLGKTPKKVDRVKSPQRPQ